MWFSVNHQQDQPSAFTTATLFVIIVFIDEKSLSDWKFELK